MEEIWEKCSKIKYFWAKHKFMKFSVNSMKATYISTPEVLFTETSNPQTSWFKRKLEIKTNTWLQILDLLRISMKIQRILLMWELQFTWRLNLSHQTFIQWNLTFGRWEWCFSKWHMDFCPFSAKVKPIWKGKFVTSSSDSNKYRTLNKFSCPLSSKLWY